MAVFNQILFPLAFLLLQSLSFHLCSHSFPQLPLLRSPGHTFQAELQAARRRSVAPLQSPEELLSTMACLCQDMCRKIMSPCRFVYHPFTHHQQPQKLYTTIHAKMVGKGGGKGFFICASQHMPFATCAQS